MNKELLEILLQFFSQPSRSKPSIHLCRALSDLCDEIRCAHCIAGRTALFSFDTVRKKQDELQITIKAIINE